MENNQIMTEKIIEDLKKQYQSFILLDIPFEEYEQLALKEINETQNDIQKNNYHNYIVVRIRKLMYKRIKMVQEDKDKVLLIINNYINVNFSDNYSYTNALNSITSLLDILKKNVYSLEEETITKLLNNKKFYQAVELVFEYNKKSICKGILVFKNKLINQILSIYCQYNSIKIVKEKEEQEVYNDITHMYLEDIGKYKILSIQEEKELFQRIKNGDLEAKKRLIENNLKLVVYIAKKYAASTNLDILDLIQEGNIGLMMAIEKFNLQKDFKFSSYASQAIHHHITRYISSQERIVRIPQNKCYKIFKYKKTREKLIKKFDKEPTIDEIAKEMNENINDIIDIIQMEKEAYYVDDYHNDERKEPKKTMFIENKTPEDIIIDQDFYAIINNLIREVPFTEQEIIVLKNRYGFNSLNKCYSLDEVGKMLNVSRQRIYEIQMHALRKIRKYSKAITLIDYTNNPDNAKKLLYKKIN